MTFSAQLIVDDMAEQRGDARRPVAVPGTLRDPTARPIEIVVHDLSASGFRMETRASLTVGGAVRLGVAGLRTHDAQIVRREGDQYGCRFVEPLTTDQVYAAGQHETVHVGAFASQPGAAEAADPVKLTIRTRLGIIASLSLVLWLTIIETGRTVVI